MALVFFMKYEGRRKGSSEEELGTESWKAGGGDGGGGGGGGMVGAGRSTGALLKTGEMDLKVAPSPCGA